MKLSRTALKCLRAVVEGRTLARTEKVFLAFGEIAAAKLIEVSRDDRGALVWRATAAGLEVYNK